MNSDALVPDVRRIAVLRANAVGDFVFALPALESLRAAYSAAEIVLLGRAWHAAFLQSRPGPVDRCIVLPPIPGVTAPAYGTGARHAFDRFIETARDERFDLALQLHGGGRHSNPLVSALGARVTAGSRAPGASALDRAVAHVYFQPEIARLLEVVAQVGAAPVTIAPRLATTAADRSAADVVLGAAPPPLALLHPGASDPRRRWSVEQFAHVGRILRERGIRVLISGTRDERPICAALSAALPEATDLCGRLSLGALLGVLERCEVVVSNDTGPLHLAVAVGTPSVGIYWAYNLVNSSPLTRSAHRPFASWRMRCPVCGQDCARDRCEHEASFVEDVDADEVACATLDLLECGNRCGAASVAGRALSPAGATAASARVPVAVREAAAGPSDTSPASARSST